MVAQLENLKKLLDDGVLTQAEFDAQKQKILRKFLRRDHNHMTIGPVQMLVLGFSEPEFTGTIAAELERLREHEFVRILDALVVQKDDDGDITALQASDLTTDEAMELGAIAGALIGLGEGDAEAGAELGALEGGGR